MVEMMYVRQVDALCASRLVVTLHVLPSVNDRSAPGGGVPLAAGP